MVFERVELTELSSAICKTCTMVCYRYNITDNKQCFRASFFLYPLKTQLKIVVSFKNDLKNFCENSYHPNVCVFCFSFAPFRKNSESDVRGLQGKGEKVTKIGAYFSIFFFYKLYPNVSTARP